MASSAMAAGALMYSGSCSSSTLTLAWRLPWRILGAVGADDGDGVAVLEDLLVAQDGTIPAVTLVGREGDQAGDAVLALDVLVGDDLVHAGDGLGLGHVDGQDLGVGDLGLDQFAVQGSGGQTSGPCRRRSPRCR